tara:strand:- start:150 stop:626 length:477 start_codon:yes stop_codon:yes gene_type:complete
MATYTDSHGFNKGTAAHPSMGVTKVSVMEVDLNFATITTDRAAAGATALAGGDVIEVLSLPAKTLVLNVGLDVTTAEGGTLTIDVGDGADPDGYLDGVNANTAASYCSALALSEGTPNTVTGLSDGKYYAAADTIDVKIVNAADAAVMRLWALVVDCS